jgi:hypothetical protein
MINDREAAGSGLAASVLEKALAAVPRHDCSSLTPTENSTPPRGKRHNGQRSVMPAFRFWEQSALTIALATHGITFTSAPNRTYLSKGR